MTNPKIKWNYSPVMLQVTDETGQPYTFSPDSEVLSRTNHTGTQDVSTITGLGSAATKDVGVADGVAPLDATGKLSSAYLPALSITDVNVVASEAEQLALTAQEGDVAIRTDTSETYIHNGGTSGTMSDWITIQTATLQFFDEKRVTTGINATVPVHSWEAVGTETDIDVALVPKGGGAISAHVADGTTTGGNKRGLYSVDLQTVRTSADQVSSGKWSVVGGGEANTASGFNSVVTGGWANVSAAVTSTVGGGSHNLALESESTVSGGAYNTATGYYSTIPGGQRAHTRDIFGKYAYASGRFAVDGDAQYGKHILRRTTYDATAAVLTTSGHTSATNVNCAAIPDNHSFSVTTNITARDTATGDTKVWRIEGAAKRGTGEASTTLIGNPVKSVIAEDAGASTWDCNMAVNTVMGTVEIEAVGEASTTIHWLCNLDTVELG